MQLDIGLFFGGAYLSYWLLIGLVAAWRWGRTAWQRRGAVKRLFDARQDQGDNSGYILVLAFAVGGMLALTVLREVPAYWLLLGLPVLVMALDEMSDIQRRAISTEIIVMIEKYRVAAAKGLAGALSDVLDWLPDGQLRSAIEDAQYKRWENKTPAECLRKLRRLNSHTREFVDALAQANYEAGAVMEASLSMLLENKKSTWASQSRANQVLKRLLPAIPPVRLFALGGLASAFVVSLFAKEIDFSNLQP